MNFIQIIDKINFDPIKNYIEFIISNYHNTLEKLEKPQSTFNSNDTHIINGIIILNKI